MHFRDRRDAGRQLAGLLQQRGETADLVMALPRGGVPVAYEIAAALHLPLDLLFVRKLGVPGQEELAMGAIASGGVMVLNREVVYQMNISRDVIEAVAARERAKLEEREHLYRGEAPPPEVRGRAVILVDDGLATGSTMRSAADALRQQGAKVLIAVPVAARATCDAFQAAGFEIVCLKTPEPFYAVGQWYDDFSQTTDEEVLELIEHARFERRSA